MCQNKVNYNLAKFSFRTSDFRCGTAKSENLAVVHFLTFKLAFGVGLKMAPIFKTPCCKFFFANFFRGFTKKRVSKAMSLGKEAEIGTLKPLRTQVVEFSLNSMTPEDILIPVLTIKNIVSNKSASSRIS